MKTPSAWNIDRLARDEAKRCGLWRYAAEQSCKKCKVAGWRHVDDDRCLMCDPGMKRIAARQRKQAEREQAIDVKKLRERGTAA